MITVFVEGPSDELFIESLFPDIEKNVVQYSNKKNDKINKHIQTLDKMNEKYFFLFDTDTKNPNVKLQEKINQIKSLNKYNCFPVIIEIESWFRAGCSDNLCRKYKIKSITNTEWYSKEKMQSEFKTEHLTNIFQEILNDFSLNSAQQLNKSFKLFFLSFNQWKFNSNPPSTYIDFGVRIG